VGPERDTELVFLVLRAEGGTAGIVAQQFSKEIERSTQLPREGLQASVRFRVIRLEARDFALPPGDLANEMARLVAAEIEEWTPPSRREEHEQKTNTDRG
jgi:hypothetical protein